MFKKKPVTTTQPSTCSADQNLPECSLIQELRNIQEELQNYKNGYTKAPEIMEQLIGSFRGYSIGYYAWAHKSNLPLLTLITYGIGFKNIEQLDLIINLLQQYKEETIKILHQEENKKELQNRESEIKQLLGIK